MLHSLRELRMYNNLFAESLPDSLAYMYDMERLDVRYNWLQSLGAIEYSDAPLKAIYADHNRISGFSEAFRSKNELIELSVSQV